MVQAYHATEAYKTAMRKRQVWVEPLFAEAKVWHGVRRFRRRGLENVNIERVADPGWPEPEALFGCGRLGPASRLMWESRGPL